MILRKWILCSLLALSLCEPADAQPQYAFRISFTDKAGSPPLSNPSAFLSPRALNRRLLQTIPLHITDQPVSPAYMDSVLTITGGKRHVTSKWLNTCVILLDDSSKILLLQNKPYITDISYVAYYQNGIHGQKKFEEETHSASSAKFRTTGNPAWYGPTWAQTNMVKGDCLHDAGYLGQGVLIAVLDDGFQYVNTNPGFDSLYTSGRILDKHNFVKADTAVYTSYFHGTEVLSTMAGYVPNAFVGAAPLAQYALYVTEDQGVEHPIEMDNMIAGMERADSLGADILSSSLGYDVFFSPVYYAIPDSQFDGNTTPVAIAANLAAAKGMLLVITAGNEGTNGLLTPGDADSVLTVGSVDINKTPASNSGYGPNTDGQTKPDVCALGAPGYVIIGGLNPTAVSGTSIATPQIAGFAACLWQATNGRTPYQIKTAIQKSAHVYSTPGVQLGYGIPDFCAAFKALGIDDAKPGADNLSVYPNPFSNELTISLDTPTNDNLLVQITDVTGKLVFSTVEVLTAGQNNVKVRIPADLSPGVYLCRLILSGEVRTVKLLKD